MNFIYLKYLIVGIIVVVLIGIVVGISCCLRKKKRKANLDKLTNILLCLPIILDLIFIMFY